MPVDNNDVESMALQQVPTMAIGYESPRSELRYSNLFVYILYTSLPLTEYQNLLALSDSAPCPLLSTQL